MKVEIWSDFVCPWCYIGKARFERALARFEDRENVTVVWRSFQLDPGAPPTLAGTMGEHLARKYGLSTRRAEEMMEQVTAVGISEGLELNFAATRGGNTFMAHRLLHLARSQGKADELVNRLFRAYFTDGVAIGDEGSLRALAVEVGVTLDAVEEVLSTDRYAEAVRTEQMGARNLGVGGVPFFLVDGELGISGAQESDQILSILRGHLGR